MSDADLKCSSTVKAGELHESHDASQMEQEESVNTSIMGKVKSRVSGILPNSFSKWFSSKNKDSLDDSGTTPSRRRGRNELNDDDDDDDEAEEIEDDDDEEEEEEDIENNKIHKTDINIQNSKSNISLAIGRNCNESDRLNCTSTAPYRNIKELKLQSREPPSKRTRINDQLENTTLNFLEHRQPLLASTPAVENAQSRYNQRSSFLLDRTSTSRSKYLNLYGHQPQREPGYEFNALVEEPDHTNDVINTLKRNIAHYESSYATSDIGTSQNSISNMARQRRTGLLDLKRQKLDSFHEAKPISSSTELSTRCSLKKLRRSPKKTTVAVDDADEAEEDSDQQEQQQSIENERNNKKYNGISESNMEAYGTNGARNANADNSVEDICNERRSECDDDNAEKLTTNSVRNVSRTSSFGNGLNFFSHLEGRKSLFNNMQELSHRPVVSNSALNNSTLSLTSLNRRKFNASIYGSTSALSDSRLLNINSPFYKGNTAFGGAASYSRYNCKSNKILSGMRALPTQIRPTSSLSSLSTSTQPISASMGKESGDHVSNLSNTAKRILDLINDFTTPLNEAKKMRNNLRANNQQQQQQQQQSHGKLGSRRLTDQDVQQTRAMRLSHVQTPYMRAAVTLQPTATNGNNKSGMPPVRELQVPSMSQLLQMKKMQNTTERSRQLTTTAVASLNYNNNNNNNITNNNSSNKNSNKIFATEYTLPTAVTTAATTNSSDKQIKYSGKMRNKLTASARITGSKALNEDNEQLMPVDLPNIAFPLMQTVPKFDIELPVSTRNNAKILNITPTKSTTTTTDAATTVQTGLGLMNKTKTSTTTMSNSFKETSATTKTTANEFIFSSPESLSCSNLNDLKTMANSDNKYTFCSPDLLASKNTEEQKTTNTTTTTTTTVNNMHATAAATKTTTTTATTSTISTLRSGSCLDVFKTSFVNSTDSAQKTDVWSKAKAPTADWECDACLIRNKQEVSKCVACETPKKTATVTDLKTTNAMTATAMKNTFGDAFKRKTDAWECPTCMISNKMTDNACVACQTNNPKAQAVTNVAVTTTKSKFLFGMQPAVTTAVASATITKTTSQNADTLFKSLAAAQTAKWECEACMTRNELSRSKCVCCEQAKPGATTTSSSTSSSGTKFAFGETAASKFKFGCAAASNVATTTATTTIATSQPVAVVSEATVPANTGFSFGRSKDVADSKPQAAAVTFGGFKFGLTTTATATNSSTNITTAKSTTATNINNNKATLAAPTGGFVFGQKLSEPNNNTTTTTTPSVKFNLPTSSTGVTSSSDTNTNNQVKLLTTPSNNIIVTSSGATTTTAAIPLTQTVSASTSGLGSFSFGNKNNTTAPLTFGTSVSSTSSGFTFGSSSISAGINKPSEPLVAKSIFDTATTTTTAATATTTTSATTASTFSFGLNVATTSAPSLSFGGFGGLATKTIAATASTSTAASITSPVSSSTSFGRNVFGAVAPNTNIFGAFKTDAATAPGNATSLTTSSSAQPTLFGSVQPTSTTPFTFGANNNSNNNNNNNSITPAAVVSSSSNTNVWPKNSFVFGNAQQPSSSSTATPAANSENNSKSLFGSFGQPTATSVSGSLFGAKTAPVAAAAPLVFGSPKPNFGTGSSNVFGNTTGFAAPAADPIAINNVPTFGSRIFGGDTAPPSFGSTASVAKSTTFGGFGSNNNVNVEAKKTEPVFNFGSNNNAPAATQNNVFGGIGGAANTTKPAFNFMPVNQPAFNFTGSSEQQQSTAAPFQFGAAQPAAPIYNFSAGNAEKQMPATNTPFQFNAQGMPPTTNIFAPNPTPGIQSAQQARRKIRTPVRRLPPR